MWSDDEKQFLAEVVKEWPAESKYAKKAHCLLSLEDRGFRVVSETEGVNSGILYRWATQFKDKGEFYRKPSKPLVLSDEVTRSLNEVISSCSEAGEVTEARVVLACRSHSPSDVACLYGVGRSFVDQCILKYRDIPYHKALLKLLEKRPPEGCVRWTLPTLAERLLQDGHTSKRISREMVRQILKAHGKDKLPTFCQVDSCERLVEEGEERCFEHKGSDCDYPGCGGLSRENDRFCEEHAKQFDQVVSSGLGLGERIRVFRLFKGMSQNRLARCMGLSNKTPITKFESGKNENPKVSTLVSIATALGVGIEDLVSSGRRIASDRSRRSKLIDAMTESFNRVVNEFPEDALEELSTFLKWLLFKYRVLPGSVDSIGELVSKFNDSLGEDVEEELPGGEENVIIQSLLKKKGPRTVCKEPCPYCGELLMKQFGHYRRHVEKCAESEP